MEKNTDHEVTIKSLTDKVETLEKELKRVNSELNQEKAISQQSITERDEKEARIIELSTIEIELTDAKQTIEEQEKVENTYWPKCRNNVKGWTPRIR
jgi:predicted RNase H-like nuclease (RuvC/YqgF family)